VPSVAVRPEGPPAAGRLNRPSPSDPKAFRFRPALEPLAARRPEGHLTSLDSWSHSAPGDPKITRPRSAPRSTGLGHPQGCPQPVRRGRSSTARPKVCVGFPPGDRTPRRPESQPGHPTPSPALNSARKPRFPGPCGSSGCPSELVFRAAMDEFLLRPGTPHKGFRRRSSRSFRPSTGRGRLSPGSPPSSTRSPTS